MFRISKIHRRRRSGKTLSSHQLCFRPADTIRNSLRKRPGHSPRGTTHCVKARCRMHADNVGRCICGYAKDRHRPPGTGRRSYTWHERSACDCSVLTDGCRSYGSAIDKVHRKFQAFRCEIVRPLHPLQPRRISRCPRASPLASLLRFRKLASCSPTATLEQRRLRPRRAWGRSPAWERESRSAPAELRRTSS